MVSRSLRLVCQEWRYGQGCRRRGLSQICVINRVLSEQQHNLQTPVVPALSFHGLEVSILYVPSRSVRTSVRSMTALPSGLVVRMFNGICLYPKPCQFVIFMKWVIGY